MGMPKKKGSLRNSSADFTINDCANAPKPVARVKKSNAVTPEVSTTELSWDQIDEEDILIVDNEDGSRNFIYKKKKHNSKTEDNIDDRPGIVYPEILWYFVSQYIEPEDISRFAGINKATYSITKRESFWYSIYRKYCQNHPKLPKRLKIEDGYKVYGLRQRVIRALYHTYDVFCDIVAHKATQDSTPHLLVGRQCVNVWYYKKVAYWSIYFKLRKLTVGPRIEMNFIEELGRIDANPEENTQVLQVNCLSLDEVPPFMGMTLCKLNVALSEGFRHHRMYLGFHSGQYNISRDINPERTFVIDKVLNMYVFDWWHPLYPHFETRIPVNYGDEERVPVLKKDFFNEDPNL